MGLFDEVNIVCPNCGEIVEFQSKAGECCMRVYNQSRVPTDIARDILNNIVFCNNCGYGVRASLAPPNIDNVEMVGV